MSFWSWISRRAAKPATPLRDVAALSKSLRVPAVHVVHTNGPSASSLGGLPRVPDGFSWPRRNAVPLDFLAQIDLSQLHACLPIPWLPEHGRLLFFYDADKQPWGFDPADRDGWQILHVPDADDRLHDARLPPGRAVDTERVPLAFRVIDSYPSWERAEVTALGFTGDESEAYIALCEAPFDKRPHHQISGYPAPIQGDQMEAEAQCASDGVYMGNADAWKALPESVATEARAWRLLLQLDSDGQMMWGDAGTLYFWIRETDARAGRFDRVWVILQCY